MRIDRSLHWLLSAGLLAGLLTTVVDARAQCAPGTTPCGTSHCTPTGAVCCASVGDESVYCPGGTSCIVGPDGAITCGGGGMQCAPGTTPCGTSHCTPAGATCCASAGDESLYCSDGASCIVGPGGAITCGGGMQNGGGVCNGYPTCGSSGTQCCNSSFPICCGEFCSPDIEACQEANNDGGCNVADDRDAPWGAVIPFGLFGAAFGVSEARARRRRRIAR